jgi:hypothetical protein
MARCGLRELDNVNKAFGFAVSTEVLNFFENLRNIADKIPRNTENK